MLKSTKWVHTRGTPGVGQAAFAIGVRDVGERGGAQVGAQVGRGLSDRRGHREVEGLARLHRRPHALVPVLELVGGWQG